MIEFTQSGSFDKSESFFKKMLQGNSIRNIAEKYGRAGVAALSAATPVDSSLTANSWDYKVTFQGKSFTITWSNSHVVDGVPIAIILQYGHGTGTGGYVAGRDYINPAMKPIFDKISADIEKEVKSA